MKTYTFEQYPDAIFKQQIEILEIEKKIISQKQLIEILKGEIEEAIAMTPELKNEQQRKAYRINAQKEPDYLSAANKLIELEIDHKLASIKLGHLRDCFNVVKLNKRQAIAQLESGEIAA